MKLKLPISWKMLELLQIKKTWKICWRQPTASQFTNTSETEQASLPQFHQVDLELQAHQVNINFMTVFSPFLFSFFRCCRHKGSTQGSEGRGKEGRRSRRWYGWSFRRRWLLSMCYFPKLVDLTKRTAGLVRNCYFSSTSFCLKYLYTFSTY